MFAQGSDFVVCRCDPGRCCQPLLCAGGALGSASLRSAPSHRAARVWHLASQQQIIFSELHISILGFAQRERVQKPFWQPYHCIRRHVTHNCEQLRQPRQKDAFGAGCFVQRELYKNVALGLVNRLMDTDDGGATALPPSRAKCRAVSDTQELLERQKYSEISEAIQSYPAGRSTDRVCGRAGIFPF